MRTLHVAPHGANHCLVALAINMLLLRSKDTRVANLATSYMHSARSEQRQLFVCKASL